jgi:hypothetical protein
MKTPYGNGAPLEAALMIALVICAGFALKWLLYP